MSPPSVYAMPYDSTTTGMTPTYVDNIPMTAIRQRNTGLDAEAMPYRPRERSMEKAFRQLCCGSCWGLCAWIVGIMSILIGVIVIAVVLTSDSKHKPTVTSPSSSSTVPIQSSSSHADSPATFLLTSTTSSQKPSTGMYTFTGTPPQPTTIVETITVTSFSTLTTSTERTSVITTPFVGSTKPATSATNLLPAPSHANLAISPRQAASTVSSAPGSATSNANGNMPAKEHRNQLARSTMIILVFTLLILLLMLGLGGLAVRRYHRNGYVWKDWSWA